MIVTEATIQNALFRWAGNRFIAAFPNMDIITGYEADFIGVTRRGWAYEYEIKLSISDFRADMKKREKHASLTGAVKTVPHPYIWGNIKELTVRDDAPENPYKALRFQCFPDLRPKFFWYVIHGFDIPEGELPTYAGLVRYVGPGWPIFEEIREAPALDAKKVDEERLIHATKNMLHRYWRMRTMKGIEDLTGKEEG